MAILYGKNTPVIKGRNKNEFEHPYKGVGTYSNWSLFHGEGPLSNMPEKEDHVPGTGRHPHGVQMSNRFMGVDNETHPMKDPGSGPELTWHYKFTEIWDMQGEDGQDTFPRDFGHEKRDTSYSYKDPWTFRGITPQPLADAGHDVRGLNDEGTANWFGASKPWIYKGVSASPLEDPGETIENKPTGLDHAFQRTQEWQGVPSARAL